MNTSPVRVRIFYPADPLGVVPGGVDTFLRGLIKFAPEDLEFSLVGMTTDEAARPVGRWTRCHIGSRSFDFFPVVAMKNAGSRGKVPLSVRYMLALKSQLAGLRSDFDVFDFHRIEPSLLFGADSRPKNFYFHNDPQTLRLSASDNLWKHAPFIYERLERKAMSTMASTWCVRDSGVETLQQRYPAQAGRIRFIPTWVDDAVFYPVDERQRERLRRGKARAFGLDPGRPWVISVGRLDTQKDPFMMLRAMRRLRRHGIRPLWLVVGDGVLRAELERKVVDADLSSQVCFLGLLSPAEIADWLRASDVYALSSAYEGMPMALLEALGCGLPAAVTDVGEVRRVVTPGVNGAISTGPGSRAFAAALANVIDSTDEFGGAPALAAVARYHPDAVLATAYKNYRALGESMRAVRLAAVEAAAAPADPARPQIPALGIPIDALDRDTVQERLLSWAALRQSRYVCFVNVHSAVHATRDECHRQVLLGADLAAPDGAPIAWTLGAKAGARQPRIDGPGTMWQLCAGAADQGIKVGLYGASEATLLALEHQLLRALPDLQLSYVHSPPFRDLSAEEDAAVCNDIARSGVGLLFVGLGCPKQERWMAAHRGRIPAVMLGVGAAFDFHAGTVSRAPEWMRESGLEWLHRLSSQPRRLGPRYLHTNSIFLAMTAGEVMHRQRGRRRVAFPTLSDEVTVPLNELPPFAEAAPPFLPQPAMFRKGLPQKPRPFDGLVARLGSHLTADRGRLVGFISSGGGEGTSTVARDYVSALATRVSRRVLLLETTSDGTADVGVPAKHPMRTRPLPGGGLVASLGGAEALRALVDLGPHADFWEALRLQFDDIVLDLPDAGGSTIGLALAPLCDGVVVVLEAGQTRAPVAEWMLADLRQVGAKVLGAVFNKRRFLIPALVYRWL